MVMQDLSGRTRALALTAATVSMLFLAACSRQPSPDAYAEPPPPPLSLQTELLGEGPAQTFEGEARAEAPPPYRAYDQGRYAPPPSPPETYAGPPRPPVVIAMEPIPNPPERAPRERRTVRVYRGGQPPSSVTLPARRAEARRAPPRGAPVQRATPARPAPAKPIPARPAQAKAAPAKPAAPSVAKATPPAVKPPVAKVTPPPQVAKAAPVTVKPQVAKVAPVTPATPPPTVKITPPATSTAAAPAKPPLVAPADRATRLAVLQTALTQALAKSAVLSAPERFTTGKPEAVTLTIPAEFADVVLSEAQKQGLSDVAASVNLNAILSGDGFAVTPMEMAARPLIAGQPTSFAWQVVARNGARGPLHVDVGADMTGAGSESLSLGSLKTAGGGFRLTPRVIGATLLVLIAGIVVAWLARSRREPPRRSSSHPETSRPAAPADKAEPAPAQATPAEDAPVDGEPVSANDHRDPK